MWAERTKTKNVAASDWADESTKLHVLGRRDVRADDSARWFAMVRAPEMPPFLLELPLAHPLSIGRLPECTIQSSHVSVSRRHAEIVVLEGRPKLIDTGSRNGCEVNSEVLASGQERILSDGDVLTVGPLTITVTQAAPTSGKLPDDVVAEAPATKECFELARRVARVNTTVLLHGETGCGKEVLAEAIHSLSPRSAGPFVRLNCAAFPENLLEAELFGHEKGAFTGADKKRIGFIESAHKGTLFLDEIGEMPASTQAKMLRVLETRRVTRIGSSASIDVDIRLVSATHRSLPEDIESGRFRADLYYRLSAFTVEIPSLRERTEDIVPLAQLFLKKACASMSAIAPKLSESAKAALVAYEWPGNVRELRNAIDHALVLADGILEAQHLPATVVGGGRPKVAPKSGALSPPRPSPPEVTAPQGGVLREEGDLRADLDAMEREAVVKALTRTDGNQTKAAAILGISRRALIHKMEKFGLKPKAVPNG
jgi:two-component system, NtrC family, response regulator AtoC